MVLPLKIAQFYGHKVPRPRLYPNVLFNDARIDPPPSVNDALLQWARDAHWSMGGLSFKRTRMQGKIEGSIRRLRAEKESRIRKSGKADLLKGKMKRSPVKAGVVSSPESELSKGNRKLGRKRDVTPETEEEEEEEEAVPKFVPASREQPMDVKPPNRSIRTRSRASLDGSPPLLQLTPEDTIAKRRKSGAVSKRSPLPKGKLGNNRKGPVRRVLLEEDSSDSDDNLEAFLEQKDRPLRRSSRLLTTPKSSRAKKTVVSDSETDSE